MRITTQLVIAAAAITFASGAFAAPAPASTDQAATQLVSVQTIAGTSARLPPADAAGLAGTYGLSNGETLRVSFERSRLFAEMGDSKTELVPAGGNSFATRGTAMRLTFDQVPFATDVTVSGR